MSRESRKEMREHMERVLSLQPKNLEILEKPEPKKCVHGHHIGNNRTCTQCEIQHDYKFVTFDFQQRERGILPEGWDG